MTAAARLWLLVLGALAAAVAAAVLAPQVVTTAAVLFCVLLLGLDAILARTRRGTTRRQARPTAREAVWLAARARLQAKAQPGSQTATALALPPAARRAAKLTMSVEPGEGPMRPAPIHPVAYEAYRLEQAARAAARGPQSRGR